MRRLFEAYLCYQANRFSLKLLRIALGYLKILSAKNGYESRGTHFIESLIDTAEFTSSRRMANLN